MRPGDGSVAAGSGGRCVALVNLWVACALSCGAEPNRRSHPIHVVKKKTVHWLSDDASPRGAWKMSKLEHQFGSRICDIQQEV
jgi:hypothetical protein